MFSYRHGFHSGNHADVLKHAALLAIVRYMTEKPVPITVVDSHAGAGMYRLDGGQAQTSGEATEGVQKLWTAAQQDLGATLAPLLGQYLGLLKTFNAGGRCVNYPGSPVWVNSQLRGQDKLKLFELHPTDGRLLTTEMRKHRAGASIEVFREDGFTSVPKFFPPASRRGLSVCDPSYEIKTDYAKVQDLIATGLTRFSTGTYFVWYPIIARLEAHNLPRRLKTLSNQAGRPWLHASLQVRGGKTPSGGAAAPGGGLAGSGIFVINPPYTLKAQLEPALPQLVQCLGQDTHAMSVLEVS